MRKKFQTGGLATLEDEEVYGGALSQFEDPSAVLLGMLASQNTTTPEALDEARTLLKERRDRGNMPQAADLALGKMQDSAEQVREVLRQARARIEADRFNPAEFWFAAASGLGSPTRTGQFGEQIGIVAENLREPVRKRSEFNRQKASDLLGIDTALATADQGVIDAELQLAQLQEQMNNRLEVEAFKTLGRRVPGSSGTRSGVVPDSMRALDSKYAEQYLNWTNTGQSDAAKSIAELDEAIDAMANSNFISGTFIGLLPKWARDLGLPESGNVQDLVEQSAARSLRLVLGGQFAQQEGENLLARTFNPRLGESTNRRRAFRLQQALNAAMANENRKAAYYQQFGTLAGFDGVLEYTLDDFSPEALERRDAAREGRTIAPTERGVSAPAQGLLEATGVMETPPVEQERIQFEDLPPDQQDRVREEYQRRTGRPPNFAKGGRVSSDSKRKIESILKKYRSYHSRDVGGQPKGKVPSQQELMDRYKLSEAEAAVLRLKMSNYKPKYQEGGPVIVLPGGEEFSFQEEIVDPAAGIIDETMTEDGWVGDALMGGAGALGLEALATRLLDPTSKSERSVLRTMGKDKIDPLKAIEDLRRSARQGVPEMFREEMGPRGRALWRRSLTHGSPDIVADSLANLEELQGGARERVEERINKGLKPYEYFDHLNKLTDALYTNAKPLYAAAYDANPGIAQDQLMTQILETPAGQRAVKSAMELFRNQPGKKIGKADALGMVRKPNLEFYDYVKRGFDQIIRKEEDKGPTPLGKAYREMRNAFRDRLDQLAGPAYKAARDQYAGDLEVLDALKEGREFHRLQAPELKERAKNMSFAERNAYRTGIAQKLLEMINSPSSDINAAKKIIGSPAMAKRLEPFFDSSRERRLFITALQKEAELFERRKADVRRGESAVERAADRESGWTGMLQKIGSGIRAVVSPLGVPSAWILRVLADRPKMTEKEANRVMEILNRSDPKEMAEFAERIRRSARIRPGAIARSGRRAGVALSGAALVGGGKELLEEDEEVEE